MGEPVAPRVEPAGVQEPPGGGGDQGVRAPGAEPRAGTEAPPTEAGAKPGEPAPAVAPGTTELKPGEPVIVTKTGEQTYKAGRQTRTRQVETYAVEHLDPNGRPMRTSFTTSRAEAEGWAQAIRETGRSTSGRSLPFEYEPTAKEPPAAAPTAEPAGAPTEGEAPAKRPVTKQELDALEKRARAAQQAFNRAERDPKMSFEKRAALRQKAEALAEELRNSEGPPSFPSWRTSLNRTQQEAAHAAALEEHAAAVDRRIHEEGGPAPAPETKDAGKVFTQMGGGRVIQSQDTKGNTWIGTGHVLIKTILGKNPLARTAAARTKEPGTGYQVTPQNLDKVVTPDPKGDYQQVTWHRRVTDSEGRDLVLGTLPNGKWVALQKPVYDALHVAAGKDGMVVAPTKGSDARFFARRVTNDKTGRVEDVAVGMPINVDQAKAEIWARGEGAQKSADLRAPVLADRAGGAGTRETGPTEPARPETDLFGQPVERPTGPGTSQEETAGKVESALAEPLTTEPDHVVPNQHVAKDATGEVVGKGPTPEATGVPQLDRLLAAREQLRAEAAQSQSPARLRYLQRQMDRLKDQAEKLAASQGVENPLTADTTAGAPEERRAGRKLPFSGPPEVGKPKDFLDYKFNDGTSVFRSVFDEAGIDHNRATSMPIQDQINILQKHMINKFGFKSVKVETGGGTGRVDQRIARDAMLDATRAITDGMASLGLPHKAASLNGRLALVYDPEGKVNYYGAYELGTGVIRIMGGANSFGHEWTHAVDHMLAERFTGNVTQANKLLTQYTRHSGLVVTDKVQAAFAKVVNTLFYDQGKLAAKVLELEPLAQKVDKNGKPTAGALEAQRQLAKIEAGSSQLRIQMSKFRETSGQVGGNRGYWQSAWEMLARAHEAYLAHTMENAGVDPRGFVMPDEAYRNMVDQQLRLAYPKEEDRVAIFKAFDELHQALRNEQVLSGGEPAGEFSNLGISDPRYWSVTAPYLSGTAEGAAMRRETNRYRNMTKMLYDNSRPAPGDMTFKRGLADDLASAVFSLKGLIQRVIDRAPDQAKRPAQAILDRLAPAPGTGKYTGRTFEEAHRFYGRDWGRRFGAILKDAGLDPNTMDPVQGEMLRHFLTTGDIAYPNDPLDPSKGYQAIPQNIQKAGGRMRFLLDEIWQALHKAGIDIGYAKSGYYPRLYDLAKISADPQGFRRKAAALHSLIFNQNVGVPGDDPGKLLEQWTGLSKEDRQMADPQLAANMAELRKNLRRQAAIEENPNPTPAEQAELQQLKQDAEDLARGNHADLRDHVATLAANNWYAKLAAGGIHDFDGTGPSGSYIKARVLPPETDQIMRDYMHTQPADALPHYFQGAARRLAFAERFGANGEDLTALLNAATQGGMRIEDRRWLENLVDTALGRDYPKGRQPLMRLTNMAHALGSLVLMPRAMWSGLAEPMNAALVTGKASAGFKIFATQFGQLMRGASARDWTEIAHFLNVTTSPMHDSIMLSRMGADYADQPALNRLMTQYYRVTGLTQLTNSQRVGGVAGSNWFLAKLARDFKSNDTGAKEYAARWLRELGLPERIHDDFSQWMLDLNGGRPGLDQLKNDPMGSAYGLAVGRLVDRIIQDPYKIDRAAASNFPVVGLAFQLMSFNYSFQHNVLNPLWDTIEHSYGQARLASEARGSGPTAARIKGYTAAGGTMMHSAAMVGTVLGAGLLVNAIRQAIFAPDQWEAHIEKDDVPSWLLDLTFQRSGLNGTMDPIIQLYSHLRYDADISSLMQGASPNWIAKNLQDVIQPYVRTNDSPNTNTIYYNQARGAFNLIGVPAAAIGLTMVGGVGGPFAKLAAGAALQLGTSPYAVGKYAETAAGGPKGTKATPQPKPGQLPSLPGLPELPGLPKLPGPGQGPAAGADTSGSAVPWGLLDDVAIPAWRYGQGVASKVPGPLKALAAAGALGYAVNDYLGKTEPYRETTRRQEEQ